MNVRSRKGRENMKTDKREIVLGAALELFSKRGYFNTSIHDIQKQANVSVGSIYHHFKNKEAIAKALFDELAYTMAKAMNDIMGRYTTAHDRCRNVISYLFKMTEENPQIMHYLLYAKHQEFLPDQKPVCSSRPFELMKNMVVQGMEEGEIRQLDPNIAATSVFGGAIRLIHLRLDGALERDLSECLDECWQCAWRSVSH